MHTSNWPQRRSIIAQQISLSDRLIDQQKFYSRHMNAFSVKLTGMANPDEALLLRYQRLSARYRRESQRLIERADEMLANRR
jgi:hypothetical protein